MKEHDEDPTGSDTKRQEGKQQTHLKQVFEFYIFSLVEENKLILIIIIVLIKI